MQSFLDRPTRPVRNLVALSGVAIAAAFVAGPLGAQQDSACGQKLVALGGPSAPGAQCRVLANHLVTELRNRQLLDSLRAGAATGSVSPRDLQSTSVVGTGAAGSAAQSEAVPAVLPVSVAGGSVAAVGTDAGTDAILSLSVNPIVAFLLDASANEGKAQLARYSRFMDLSAFFPVSGLDEDENGKVDYFGVRLRLNFAGLSVGDAVFRQARETFAGIVASNAALSAALMRLLDSTATPAACADSILVATSEAIQDGCGRAFTLPPPDAATYGALREAIRRVREKADSKYFGVDIRADFGDPTLGEVPDASGTYLFAGLAVGRRFASGAGPGSAGFRGRLGVRHSALDVPDTTHFALDGGFALELTRTYEDRQINVGSGFEFRYGSNTRRDDQLQTNFLLFRFSLSIPVTAANSIALSIGAPIAGGENITPTLSIAADWGLLLPQLREGGRP